MKDCLCTLFQHLLTSASQISGLVVGIFASLADGLNFNSPFGYKGGHCGHYKYEWVGQYEPCRSQFPFVRITASESNQIDFRTLN